VGVLQRNVHDRHVRLRLGKHREGVLGGGRLPGHLHVHLFIDGVGKRLANGRMVIAGNDANAIRRSVSGGTGACSVAHGSEWFVVKEGRRNR
jgi:hypothetical protein